MNSIMMGFVVVLSSSKKPLTDLFYTQAFSGAWEVFSKFNWLGWLMQFIISAFCLIGLFLLGYQILITLLYLSARSTFDRIHELKQAGHGGKALGLGNLFKDNIVTANNGTGLDAIVSFGLSLLPDVKAYSDYGDERRSYNLQDDDTVTTYILKKALPTVMTIFFFAIGFNGTLFRAYGSVVDAMAAAAENVVDVDLTRVVNKWMNSGSAYQFTFDDDGSKLGAFRQRVAETMYQRILAKSDDLSTDQKLAIGAAVENYVSQNMGSISEGFVGNTEVAGFKGTDDDCANLEFSAAINGTQSYGEATSASEISGEGIPISTFGLTGDSADNYYIHVIITRKKNTNGTNYFQMEDDSGSNGGGGNQFAPSGY